MTDKELLEAAARAAGVACSWAHEDEADYSAKTEGMWLNGARSPDNSKFWNPLTDDGDALRLAVKLDIDFYMGADSDGPEAWAGYYVPGRDRKLHACEPIRKDPYAATRRTIVRAAAAIGSLHNARLTGPQREAHNSNEEHDHE